MAKFTITLDTDFNEDRALLALIGTGVTPKKPEVRSDATILTLPDGDAEAAIHRLHAKAHDGRNEP